MLRPLARLLVPVLVVTAAPTAQAAWFPPLKPSAARKKPSLRGVASVAAARPTPKATARPAPRPTPTPVPTIAPTPEAFDSLEPADPTPDPVHPAGRVVSWRPVGPDTPTGNAFDAEFSLWQGDWGISGGLLSVLWAVMKPAAAATPGTLGYAGELVVPSVVLRRRFGGSPATLTLEAGWTSLGAIAPAMGLGGVTLEAPVRTRWFNLSAAVRSAAGPGGIWYADGRAGFRIVGGPASLGLGWRHMAIGAGGTMLNVTGPEVSGGIVF